MKKLTGNSRWLTIKILQRISAQDADISEMFLQIFILHSSIELAILTIKINHDNQQNQSINLVGLSLDAMKTIVRYIQNY